MADEPPPLDFGDEDQHQEKEEEEEKSPFDDPKVEELVEEPQAPDESKLEGDGISCKNGRGQVRASPAPANLALLFHPVRVNDVL